MKNVVLFIGCALLCSGIAIAQTTILSEGFEENDPTGALPTASSLVTAPATFSCTNGTWQLFKAYRASASATSGQWALRILKSNHSAVTGVSYIVTPELASIGKVSFDYKRGRPLDVLYSTNNGVDWQLAFTCTNTNPISGKIENQVVNVKGPVLMKIQDNTAGDDDVDNLVVTSADATSVEVVSSNVPTELSLKNYPNPFNPRTKIIFSVKTTGKATVTIYDMRGRVIDKIFDGIAKAGEVYQVPFGFELAASGIYYARLESADGVRTQKMVYMK